MISCVVSTPREMIYKITAIWLTYRYIHLLREVYADGIYLVIYSNQFIQVEKYIENIFEFLCVKDIFSKYFISSFLRHYKIWMNKSTL